MTPHFDGSTYEPEHDWQRLNTLLARVWRFMADNRWHTIPEIRCACGGSEASVSARLRDFRKDRFGAFVIERERTGPPGAGMFRYRMLKPEPKGQMAMFEGDIR